MVEDVHAVIQYAHQMDKLSNEEGLLPGLGVPTLNGAALIDPTTGKTREVGAAVCWEGGVACGGVHFRRGGWEGMEVL